jgi:phage-related protein
MEKTWTVQYYQDSRGTSPVEEFIRSLPRSERAQTIRLVERLEQWGTRLGMPHARHIEGPLWELRPRRSRYLYVAITGRRIIILHGFHKQKGKAPRQDIELAFRRLAELEHRQEI